MTELDYTILAIIARDGPLSAYDVRKVFAQSLTSTWSSSTGSIYPSIRRLEKARFVASSAPKGARARKTIRVTDAGRVAIENWLNAITPEMAGPTAHPVRTRMYFLGILSPAKRSAIIRKAIVSTQSAATAAEQRRDARSDASRAELVQLLASEGVLYELGGRLRWLEWLEGEAAELDNKE
jgi:DNA-binding PadR family transcriptional regulator